MKITPRGKGETPWGDFHACSRFARSTIPEKKFGLRAELFNSTVEMEKGTEKGHWEKRPIPFFEKTFIFFSYRIVIDLQDIWFLNSGSVKNIWKNSFLFYNFVKHSWSCGLSLICEFKSGLLIYSLLGLRFLSSGFFFFAAAVFHNINAHTNGGWGGGGSVWTNNKYQVLNNNLNEKKKCNTASNYILLCHADHYNV